MYASTSASTSNRPPASAVSRRDGERKDKARPEKSATVDEHGNRKPNGDGPGVRTKKPQKKDGTRETKGGDRESESSSEDE